MALTAESPAQADPLPHRRAWRDLARRRAALFGDLGAAALLLVLTALFYWRILTLDAANRAAFPKGDFIEQFYPFAYYRAQEILAGNLPLWNPFAFGGQPFLADIQSAIFYPPSWVTTLLAGPRGYPLVAYEAEAIAHIFLGGLFAYLFLSRLTGSRFGGLLGGTVFAFGGYLSSYPSQQLSILEVQVWLPLALLVVHQATRRQPAGWARQTGFLGLVALILGIALTAGHPQASMYVFYAYTAYAAYRTAALWRETGRGAWRTGLALALALPLAVGLAAVQLLPTYEFSRLSSRAEVSYDFTWWGFPLKDLLQLFLPRIVSQMSPMYVGILPLALVAGAAGLFAGEGRWRGEVRFWLALALVALLVSFGGHTFLYSPLYLFAPGLATFRDQERTIYLFSLAVAALAAFGAAAFPAGWSSVALRRAGRALLALAAAAAFAGFLLWLADIATQKLEGAADAAAFTVIISLLGAALLYPLAARPSITAGQSASYRALLFGLVVFDLFTVNWQNNVARVNPDTYFQKTGILAFLQEHAEEGRVFNEYQLPLNYGDVYRVYEVNGASPLVLQRYKDLLTKLPQQRALALLGVKYLVTWQGGPPGGKRLGEEDKKFLYEMADPMPAASVINDLVVEPDAARALAILAEPDFDYRQRAVVEQPLDLPPGPARPAELRTRRPQYLDIALPGGPPGLLVLPETEYPGWQALVDGRPQPIIRVNTTFRGVVLPAGARRAEFVFAPASVRTGAIISFTALLILVTLFAVWRFRRDWPSMV